MRFFDPKLARKLDDSSDVSICYVQARCGTRGELMVVEHDIGVQLDLPITLLATLI